MLSFCKVKEGEEEEEVGWLAQGGTEQETQRHLSFKGSSAATRSSRASIPFRTHPPRPYIEHPAKESSAECPYEARGEGKNEEDNGKRLRLEFFCVCVQYFERRK